MISWPRVYLPLPWLRVWARICIWSERLLLAFIPLCLWVSGVLLITVSSLAVPIIALMGDSLSRLFWLGVIVLTWRAIHTWLTTPYRHPDRFLEQESHLAHRPLQTLDDQAAGPDITQALWVQAQNQARNDLQHLILPRPPKVWIHADPYVLRGILALLAILVFSTGIIDHPEQGIRNILWPWASDAPAAVIPDYALTITPPAYTNWPISIYPGITPTNAVSLLPGTEIKVTVSPEHWPRLFWLGWRPYQVTGTRNLTTDATIAHAGHLTLQQGLSRVVRVPFTQQADTPPTGQWDGTPVAQADGQIKLPLKIQDDFGIETARITLSPAPDLRMTRPALANTEYIDLPLTIVASGEWRNVAPVIDLTDSLWAGRQVEMTINLFDHLGQGVTLPSITLQLPEKSFRDNTAKILYSARKGLITQGFMAKPAIGVILDKILGTPARFKDDSTSVIALRVAAAHTRNATTQSDLRSIAQMMWQVALRLEDGGNNVRAALRNLEQAQKNLADLINKNNMNADEIDQAMQDLQSALAHAMQAMMDKLSSMPPDPKLQQMMEQFPDIATQEMDSNDLNDFLRQLQAELKSGNRDKAQQMLKQLQQLSSQLRNPMTSMPADMMGLMNLIDDIQKLITAQKELRAQTAPKAISHDQTATEAARQHQLQQDLQTSLDKIKTVLPIIPQNFSAAQQAMATAHTALGQNDAAGSLPHQDRAIDELQKQQGQMAQQLQSMMKGMVMMKMPGGQPGTMGTRGPGNGRGDGQGMFGTENFDTPEQGREGLRDILQKLRDRAGGNPPREEREYFERLLKQF